MRLAPSLLLSAFALALASCSSSPASSTTPKAGASQPWPSAPATPSCPDGTQWLAADGRCEPVLPAADCAPGTFARPGATACVPTGWTTPCPAGFAQAQDGWGCTELLPRTACTGATREDAQTGTCVPIGDCTAPFPPANATLFVDASLTPAMLNATHFVAIQDAVNAAPDGAVIAIAPGQYTGSVGVIGQSLSLVGKCAAEVVIQYASGPTSGIFSDQTLDVSGVTVTGFPGGVLVQGGQMTLEDSLIEGNVGVGLFAQNGSATVRRTKITGTTFAGNQLGGGVGVLNGATLTIEDSASVDNVFANLLARNAKSSITANRVVASRNTTLSATPDAASVMANDSAQITVSQSIIADTGKFGVEADTLASISISESVIRASQGTLASNGGVGIFAGQNGTIQVHSSLVAEHPVVGAYVSPGGTLLLDGIVFRGPADPSKVVFGRGAQSSGGNLSVKNSAFLEVPQSGIAAQAGGHADLDTVLVRNPYPIEQSGVLYGGFGLEVEVNSTATIARSAFDGCSLAALSVAKGSTVTASDLLIEGTLELAVGGIGSAVQVFEGSTFTLDGGLLLGSAAEGLITSGSTVTLSTTTISGTQKAHDGSFGHGLVALANATVSLTDVGVDANAAIGIASDNSQIRMVRGAVNDNAVGMQVQDGSFLSQSDDPGDLQSGEVRVSSATIFSGDASKLGNGVVPLPTVSAQ